MNFQSLLLQVRHHNLSDSLEYRHLTPEFFVRKYYVAYRMYRCISWEFGLYFWPWNQGVGLYNEHQLLRNRNKENNRFLLPLCGIQNTMCALVFKIVWFHLFVTGQWTQTLWHENELYWLAQPGYFSHPSVLHLLYIKFFKMIFKFLQILMHKLQ